MLDHGTLNIKGRTSGINHELDRYKADNARSEKAKRKENAAKTRELRAEAKALLSEHEPMLLSRYGEKFCVKEMKSLFKSKAHFDPAWIIAFIKRAKAEMDSK